MTNPIKPLVSVVLPAYNCPQYIQKAIDSILQQTLKDFELIIIDDGSKDNTLEIIKQNTDPRIKIIHQENQGLASTLNNAISIAQGKYIARQDQDDISFPERLEKQVSFLKSHLNCGIVGSWSEIWEGDSKTKRKHRHPISNSDLQYELLFDNPFVHSSMMIRKTVLLDVGGYSTDPERQPPEDYELWSRIARKYQVANIPETLIIYREIPNSMSRSGVSPFITHLINICSENIGYAAHIPTNTDIINIAALTHLDISRIDKKPSFNSMEEILDRAIQNIPDLDLDYYRSVNRKRINRLKFEYWKINKPRAVIRIIMILLRLKKTIIALFINRDNQ